MGGRIDISFSTPEFQKISTLLRPSALASWLAQSWKATLMELQKLMRYKNITMIMRYAHLFPGQESEKRFIIGDMLV